MLTTEGFVSGCVAPVTASGQVQSRRRSRPTGRNGTALHLLEQGPCQRGVLAVMHAAMLASVFFMLAHMSSSKQIQVRRVQRRVKPRQREVHTASRACIAAAEVMARRLSGLWETRCGPLGWRGTFAPDSLAEHSPVPTSSTPFHHRPDRLPSGHRLLVTFGGMMTGGPDCPAHLPQSPPGLRHAERDAPAVADDGGHQGYWCSAGPRSRTCTVRDRGPAARPTLPAAVASSGLADRWASQK